MRNRPLIELSGSGIFLANIVSQLVSARGAIFRQKSSAEHGTEG
jgi:hypothetical protein